MTLAKAIAVSLALHLAVALLLFVRFWFAPPLGSAEGFAVLIMGSSDQNTGRLNPASGPGAGIGPPQNPGTAARRGARTGTISQLLNSIPYPPEAEEMQITGTAVVSATLEKDGAVRSVSLVKSSGSGLLDRAALDGIRGWIFTDSGTASVREIRVKFTLK